MDYIQGIVKTITYYNEENAFIIMKIVKTDASIKRSLFDHDRELMTVKGYLPKPLKGETYRFFGQLEMHDTYGEQFHFQSFEKISETNIEGLIDYLSSDLFPGVGEKTATRIVQELGAQSISKIIDNPDVLDRIPRLSKTLKQSLSEQLIQHKATEQTLIQLYGYGLSSRMATKIIKTYAHETMQILTKNPYVLIEDIDGIGFERADVIAKKIGFDDAHPLRIQAILLYFFKHITTAQGHTHVPLSQFLETVLSRLNKETFVVDETVLESHLDTLIKAEKFVKDEGMITLKQIDRADKHIVDKLKTLLTVKKSVDDARIEQLISTFERLEKITYNALQKAAIKESFKHGVFILTGGPGTGKTTVIKGLIYVYYNYHNLTKPSENELSTIHLIAPTGRAAKRMNETTHYYATTIHRLLGYGYDGQFYHDQYTPIPGDLFIIDEASMIDVYLASQLLQSIPNHAQVIFVGDEAQLPSVGPGQVLKDLLDVITMPQIALEHIHRQAEGSHIIELAQAVRKGTLPSDMETQESDRYVINLSPHQFKARLQSMIDYLLRQGYDLHEDIQVLIPMYKGEQGIDEINRFLQEKYNPNKEKSLQYGDKVFRINDKVLQLVNQAEDGIMNGDQGVVIGIDTDNNGLIVQFIDKEVMYKKQDLANITLAYAMSIHKSQGSEYKVVILPLFRQYMIMLKRKLIYTALTRAKEILMIVGQLEGLSYAVERIEESRITRLKDKIMGVSNRETMIEEAMQALGKAPLNKVWIIEDETIPFDTLGEPQSNVSPYDFMDNDKTE